MITGKHKEDVAMVAEKLMIAFVVEYVKSSPNAERWKEAILGVFEIATVIVDEEYKFLEKEK